MSFLSIKNLHKSFDRTQVLKNVSIDINEGDFLVLVGPSGCGKSTLLNIIAGLETVSSGDVFINGKNITNNHPSQRDIAMVFQSYALYPNMTVKQNLSFGLEMHKVKKAEREARIKEVGEILQIDNLLNRKPSALSGGQRQRVAMGRALVRRPQIFLFDEPLSNLDAKLRVDMRTEIKRLYQQLGVSIIYVTHDQIEALTLSTKIAVMNKGIVQQLGTADDIYYQPKNVFVAQFMGSPAMNILTGMVQKNDNQFFFTVKQGEHTVSIKLDEYHQFSDDLINQDILLGIRPEAIKYDGAEQSECGFEVTVDLVEPAGADCFLILSLLGQTFTARVEGKFQIKEKSRLKIYFAKDSIHFFNAQTEEKIYL